MEYQGTKEELDALMLGEAAGTAARFAVGFYGAQYILFPVLCGLLIIVSLFSVGTAAILGLLILVACVLWVLDCASNAGRKPEVGYNLFFYKGMEGQQLISLTAIQGDILNPEMNLGEWMEWRDSLPLGLHQYAGYGPYVLYAEFLTKEPKPGWFDRHSKFFKKY